MDRKVKLRGGLSMRRVIALFTVLLCYAGLSLIFISWSHFYEIGGPTAENGQIDLTHWNFEKDGILPLNGTWHFYPNRLLSPDDIHAGKGGTPQRVSVPNNAQSLKRNRIAQSGTYRLLLNAGHAGQMFGLQTTIIYSANRIYMNGRLIGHSGTPAIGHRLRASLRPYVAYFPLKKGTNELIVQSARLFGTTSWDIAKPIFFGTQSQITDRHGRDLFNDMVMIIPFFFMALYFFGYYLQRRRDIHLLFFSIFCLLFSIAVSWIGRARVIYLFFPDLSLNALTVLEAVNTIALTIAVFLYLYFAFSRLVSKHIIEMIVTLSLITLLLDFLPFDVFTGPTMLLHSFLAISAVLYASYIFILATIQKMEGGIYLTLAAFSMSIYVIITTINAYSSKAFNSVYSISSLIFLLMLSLVMSKRFSAAFDRSESLTRELTRTARLKDEFLAKTSHEFRTPLNGIVNIAQTLMSGNKQKTIGEEKKKLQMIVRIGYRLSAVVNDILDLEKIKQGELALKRVPLDVSTTVKAELPFYRMLAEKKGLTVIDHVPSGLPLVFADENRFRQILNNLVDNAIKYTASGRITLSATLLEEAIEISVSDTGPGIPAPEQAMIFQAFKRRDQWNQSEGAGLGLSIVAQLTELQNGRVWVNSAAGRGSAFHFTMPLFDAKRGAGAGASVRVRHEAGERPPQKPAPSTPYRSPHVNAPEILVVDDDTDNLNILIDMLEGIPYNVAAASSGTEALRMLMDQTPDLVILDVMMPGMSGFEVCRKIREQYTLIDLPVLMLTAAIINEDKHLAFRAGANDILQKPFNFSEFSARIHGLILMKQAAGQATNMEVAFLQSQIRPHFLYNVLNSIIALSYDDVEKSREMTAEFATYLRRSFDFRNTSAMSTFRNELALVKSYLVIEKMRFQDRIRFQIDVPDGIDFTLPPLLIQPLVENAVRHGIGKRKTGGTVTLSVRQEEGNRLIRVADDGVGMTQEQIASLLSGKSRSVGLKNINSRLKHLYGNSLQVVSQPGKGTIVIMRIPEK
jgi:signal transduction histidine kinase/CheY-like chemotaxis protein